MLKNPVFLLMALAATACASAPVTETAAETQGASRSWADALGAAISDPYKSPEHRAFDFWIGEWEANWRGRPEGEFHHQKEGSWTRQRVFPILGGKALVELAWARDNPQEASQRGFSIRYFDPARERWVMAQNWPGPGGQGTAFLDQLIGEEHLGRLTMYSITRRPDADGQLITQHRRYNFTDVRPGVSFRWDGSNTPDEGATWFTWNVVDFLRQRDLDAFRPAGASFPGVHERNLCTNEPHGAMNEIEGVWRGNATAGDGGVQDASLSAGLTLDGCGVMGVLERGGARTFLAFGHTEIFNKWVMMRLDDQPGTLHAYYVSDAPFGAFAEAPGLAIEDEFAIYLSTPAFDVASAERRYVFETVEDRRLVLREEVRQGGGAWRLATRYRLQRD